MATEIHSLLQGFDIYYVMKHLLKQLLYRKVGLETALNYRSALNDNAKKDTTSEKRLLMDIHALEESFAAGELSTLGFLRAQQNPGRPHDKGYGQVAVAGHRVNYFEQIGSTNAGWTTLAIRKTKHNECKLSLTPNDSYEKHLMLVNDLGRENNIP